MSTHLIIPDSHCKPDVPNTRWEYLAKFILDLKPDVIINLGDMFDMASLCTYDKGKKCFEGRRYKKDLEVGYDALNRFHDILNGYNKTKFLMKKKQYRPDLVFTIGNHEYRINKAIEADSVLEGTISLSDLKLEEFGWIVIPFLKVIEIDGVMYSHYFVKSGSNYAIGGENAARSILLSNFQSSTCGHSHKVDYSEHRNSVGRSFYGHVAGNFLDEQQFEEYAGYQGNAKWSRPSVSIKRQVKDGKYLLEIVSLERLKEVYK